MPARTSRPSAPGHPDPASRRTVARSSSPADTPEPTADVPELTGDTRQFYEQRYHFDRDIVIASEARLARALDRLEPMAGRVFLDLGSGVGWAAHLAQQRGAILSIGADFAWRALRLGADHIPGVARLQADGCRLPLPDGSVDRLLSFGSLEHFPDVDLGLREIARV